VLAEFDFSNRQNREIFSVKMLPAEPRIAKSAKNSSDKASCLLNPLLKEGKQDAI